MRRAAVLACSLALLAPGTSGAHATARSWAAPQIATVVDAGLLATSIDDFRPDDPITSGELATVLAALGAPDVMVDDPGRVVSMRELDARLVSLAGLRPEARLVRRAALDAGLAPTPWLGTETVARMLGFRINHERGVEELELQVFEPTTRAEAAYSLARYLALDAAALDGVRDAVASFAFPLLSDLQRMVLARALRFVGSPYVFAGTSERPQQVFGRLLPGGFDCSGLVWRVYKLEPFPGAERLGEVLRGRSSYAMSGEVARSARIGRDALQPADLVFFGDRGPRSRPAEVGHMGIYLGNGWMVHSSRFGTTLAPMTGWYEATFAWGRRPLAEARIS